MAMETHLFLMAAVLVMILVLAYYAYRSYKVSEEETRKTGKRPKGYYVGLGMALGLAIGMPLGIALDMVALGPAMGLPIGLALGSAWEEKHKDKLRPLTAQEQQNQRTALKIGIVMLILGVVLLAAVYLTAA